MLKDGPKKQYLVKTKILIDKNAQEIGKSGQNKIFKEKTHFQSLGKAGSNRRLNEFGQKKKIGIDVNKFIFGG